MSETNKEKEESLHEMEEEEEEEKQEIEEEITHTTTVKQPIQESNTSQQQTNDAGQNSTNVNNNENTSNNQNVSSPQDQFFNFYTDNHGNPTYTKEFDNDNDDDDDLQQDIDHEIEENMLQSTLDSSYDDSSSMNGTTCCFACLLVLIAIALIAAGVGLNYGFMPPRKRHTHDPNYPECNEKAFNDDIKKLIAIPLSTSIQEMKETQKLENDGYDMSQDINIIQNIVKEIKDKETELILLYGAIEKHKGTIEIFDQIEENTNEPLRVWFIDATILNKYNGTLHERTACLFNRADEWVKKHKNYRLLVVFDHLSHYYQQNKQIQDRGIIWNQLDSLIHWKKSNLWTLFIVESNPNMINIQNINYAEKIFYQNQKTKAICIPFNGGIIFEKVIKRLTSTNSDVIKIQYQQQNNINNNDTEDIQWQQLTNYMKYFAISDAFAIYYTRIRTEAKEKYTSSGVPITFEFDHILEIVQQYNSHFQDADVESMKRFAMSIGQTQCFNHNQNTDSNGTDNIISSISNDQTNTDLNNKPSSSSLSSHKNKQSKISKSTILSIAVIMAIIIIILLVVWSCYVIIV